MRLPILVVHADWGTAAKKRWLGEAVLDPVTHVYEVRAPAPVGSSSTLLERLLREARNAAVLIGFDFPIGLPLKYAEAAGIRSFKEALPEFGWGRWRDFYAVADAPEDLSLTRPFYPQRPLKGVSHAPLLIALKVQKLQELLRICEQPTAERNAACCLFWTLGGNQVGKGAISGWSEFVAPAVRRDHVRLWPFDGPLAELLVSDGLVIAETYPREFYDHLGIRLSGSKRQQSARRQAAAAVNRWLADPEVAERVTLSEAARRSLDDGFGIAASGEDAFDAFIGLFGMLNVILSRRADAPLRDLPHDQLAVEGWILGQHL